MLFFVEYLKMRLYIKRSKIFGEHGRTEISLQFHKSVFLSFTLMGVTLAIFSLSGKISAQKNS